MIGNSVRKTISLEKLAKLHTVDQLLAAEYGERGTLSREEFDAKSREWYSQLSQHSIIINIKVVE